MIWLLVIMLIVLLTTPVLAQVAPPIDFNDPHWLQDLLLYLATAWLAFLVGQKRNGPGR